MNILFINARILTMEEGKEIFKGVLWVCGNRITYVGAEKESAPIKWDRIIDCQGNLLMPGFKNAHTHSGMTFLRSYADDLPLQEWLQQKVFPMEGKITSQAIYECSRLAVLEYLTSGITANFDMYLTPDTIAKASLDCGFRTVLCGAVNNFTQSVPEMEQWYQKYNQKDSLISYQLGFHAEYTTSENILKDIAALAHSLKAPVFTHNSETGREVQDCVNRNGQTPTAYLDRLGIFQCGGGGFHCVHLSEEDMEIFQARDLYAVTNPASNLKLASGIAPIADFLKKKISVAIGTDGPASNNCLDMFREMFLVTGLSKLREQDAAAMDAMEILKMATVQGAKAMGLTDCDVLAEGKLADIIMIDLARPNMQPLHNIGKNLVYSGSKENVKMTMIDGVVRYEEGEFSVGEEAESIYEKVNGVLEKL